MITSLQNDGYNVYTNFDGELMDIELCCCMDYFWAKGKNAQILELKYGRTDYACSVSPLTANWSQEPVPCDYRDKTMLINYKI